MKKGYRNKITDVKGVRVGHKTIAADNVQTGVTVILPTEGDIFREKLTASCHVINGFGKTGGLIQLEELGVRCVWGLFSRHWCAICCRIIRKSVRRAAL